MGRGAGLEQVIFYKESKSKKKIFSGGAGGEARVSEFVFTKNPIENKKNWEGEGVGVGIIIIIFFFFGGGVGAVGGGG